MSPSPRPRRLSTALLALVIGAATVFAAPITAQAAPAGKPKDHPTRRACAQPERAGEMACLAYIRSDVAAAKGVLPRSAQPDGFGPADLQSAYDLPSATAGNGQTVAVILAFDNSAAEADLAVYRQQYGLPPCTTANGCFRKVDQRGGTSFPPPNAGWAAESALDLDMVSATCPNCHILLVEADDNSVLNLGAAVNKAVELGATYVSNSYGGSESSAQLEWDDAFFKHPGVVVTASSGDDGFGLSYPASSPNVTGVGGTSLARDGSARGWTESAWAGAGSGCSVFSAKPEFQADAGCAQRTVADVSAVADPDTGVAVYHGGWQVFGGTSASAPIIAGAYALAGATAEGSFPNAYPYDRPSALNDVTSGGNGSCGTDTYLCTAGAGYDGPTGLGTPKGVAAFRTGPSGTIGGTVTDAAGAPLGQARVVAGDLSTTTDPQGRYSLSVPVGTYDVTASKLGYASRTAEDVTVEDGQAATADFALPAQPQVTLSGLVRDGSGHGWPLYATVGVKDEPTSTVYTDPRTGRYSVKVPADATHAIQVNPIYPGYQPIFEDVAAGTTDLSHDFAGKVDPVACGAAGYAFQFDGSTEPFDAATAPPPGWTVTDAVGNGQTWRFDDFGERGNLTGGTGNFAIVDSDAYGRDTSQDTSLVSPVLDFSSRELPVVSFRNDYNSFSGQTADVEYTVDGGTTWTNVWHHTNDDVRGPGVETVPLPAAAGQPAVQVRFRFTGSFGWWWQVDDVFFGDRLCAPVSGGLVVGNVTDMNTGGAVNGATVTSTDRPAEQATTAATPDDPNLADGFYWMFSTLTGGHPFAASAVNYTDQSATVNVAPSWATEANFALGAARVTVTPVSISKTLNWQGTATPTVTIKNTGSAPATVRIGEETGGFTIQSAGAPLRRVKANVTPHRLGSIKPGAGKPAAPAPAAPPWTAVADYPTPVMDNGVALGDGKIFSVGGTDGDAIFATGYAYDPALQGWSPIANMGLAREAPQAAYVGGRLYVSGGWGADGATVPRLEIYDPWANSWSAGADVPNAYAGAATAVLGGKIYVVGGCTDDSCGVTDVQVYDPATNAWATAADYPEPASWLGCGQISGALYCTGGATDAGESRRTFVYDPDTNTWAPLADLPVTLWAMGYSSVGGRLLVSGGSANGTITNEGFAYDPAANAWTPLPNANNTLYRGGSACGFYKIGGAPQGFDAVPNGEVLPGLGQCAVSADVPWLSPDKTTASVAPGKSVKVKVTLNANVPEITQPGTYTAEVTVGAPTPYPIPPVAVTMAVNPPRTWGKVTGTITGVRCDGTSTPIAGATLQIDTWAAGYTLKTDANGQYAYWLDVRHNPLTLITAKDGWAPQTRTVRIIRQQTTTANFALKPDHPCT